MAEDNANASAEAKRRIVRALRGGGAHLRIADAVNGFPGSLMNTAPEHVPYTFWHQLEHIRICQWDTLQYILDPKHISPEWPGEYWPAWSVTADRIAWDETIAQYYSDLEEFVRLIERDDIDLLEPVAHNNGRSIFGSALIVVDHTSYHLGEFVMGRQMLGAWKSEL